MTDNADAIQPPDRTGLLAGGAGAVVLSRRLSGDTADRFQLTADGSLLIGDGVTPPGNQDARGLWAWQHLS